MSAMVACHQCKTVVERASTVFTTDGELLCGRCGAFDAAHAQVERARAAAHESASQHSSAIGLVIGAVERAAANRRAGEMHGELVATARTATRQQAAAVPCSRCRAMVLRAETTLSLEGEPMCRECAAGYDAVADRRRLEGSLFVGFLWGFFLSFVGVGLTHLLQRKPAEKKGAMVAAFMGLTIAYVASQFMFRR